MGKRHSFADMPEERRKAVAAKGGRTAHANGKAHRFTPEEASEAGKVGGHVVSRDRKHMSDIAKEYWRKARGWPEPDDSPPRAA